MLVLVSGEGVILMKYHHRFLHAAILLFWVIFSLERILSLKGTSLRLPRPPASTLTEHFKQVQVQLSSSVTLCEQVAQRKIIDHVFDFLDLCTGSG